ncbi:hypothetical protein BGZ60DRAFT_428359 [Tricladium varicosporioides]|nr:hypothetical protein BGZ60DRAFT_428359 [Hymenoscyphus varicosporioides]
MALTCSEPLPPILFSVPSDPKPDTLFQVFEQPFHVSSTALKMHSAFFRKFLDSPDKAKLPSHSGCFKYRWISSIDSEGTWSLVCYTPDIEKDSQEGTNKLKSDKATEINAFRSLMSAIHMYPFDVTNVAQLVLLTGLADYYCALPRLSDALYRTCLRNPHTIAEIIRLNSCVTLEIAAKLRNEVLFKECAAHAINPWGNPAFRHHAFEDHRLKEILQITYGNLCEKVVNIQQQILLVQANLEPKDLRQHFHRASDNVLPGCLQSVGLLPSTQKKINLPAYFRGLSNSRIGLPPGFKDVIAPILSNNLVLAGSGTRTDAAGSDGFYYTYFLCTKVPDESLPWDLNDMDW